MDKAKSFNIPKALVLEAFKCVKANKGAAGVDEESIRDFEKKGIGNSKGAGGFSPGENRQPPLNFPRGACDFLMISRRFCVS